MICPKFSTTDIAGEFELYLEAIKESYEAEYGRNFCDERRISSTGRVDIVSGSRFENLAQRMQHGFVVGLYFPSAFQGFSIEVSREQVRSLPDGFTLSGFDAAAALIMYPEVLACSLRCPGLYLTGLVNNNGGVESTYCFKSSDGALKLSESPSAYEGRREGSYSPGLFFSDNIF